MTEKLKVLDLFSGFGMFSLGLHRAGGFETVAFCEISEYPRKVLNARYPGVKIYEDVCTLTPERLAADGIAPSVICGGFPCQDLSLAGKGEGLGIGTRSGLYREVIRLARDLRPRFILLENVAALLDRGLGIVLGDLAEIGYDAEWHCIPASYIGAWHRRDRVWLVAYPRSVEQQQRIAEPLFRQSDLQGQPSRGIEEWPGRANLPSPRVCGKDDGPPSLVERIHGLGNGLHPGIAERIGRAVMRAAA